jgi:thymidine kinase
MFTLPPLSHEQEDVVKGIKEEYNVKVSGVAGCGKTTTILNICVAFPEKKILVLTYNARLKIETREKVEKLELTNTEVHSYHAMCVRFYSAKGSKDDGIIDVIYKDTKPKRSVKFDVIIMDECQDMTKCYYDFVKKIVRDNKTTDIVYCLFGDEKQNIFEFKGADERFLTHGPLIFQNAKTWREVNVHTSFRVSNQIAGFVNKYLIGYEKIKACKEGSKVRYMYINPFKHRDMIYKEVLFYLAKGYKHDDIFILGPSIKKNGGLSPIVKLENTLVKNGHPCFAPVSDDAKIDEEVMQGKIVFSTFHQVKGLERRVVIMFNFDFSYFKYFGRELQIDKCPNIIYVATTRAIENLTVIHGCDHQPILPTITYDSITQDSNVIIVGGIMAREEFAELTPKLQDKIPIKVTELIKFLDAQVIVNAVKMLEYTLASPETGTNVNLPQKAVCTKKKTAEIVYDINGYAIPTFFEMSCFKTCSLLNHIDCSSLDSSQQKNYNKIAFKFGQENTLPINYLLYISTLYDATLNGYMHRTKQIASYDWLSSEDLDICNDVLRTHVGGVDNVSLICFELLYKNVQFLQTKYSLTGIVDILNKEKKELWEIKCTSSIDNEHIIQLAIYAWMSLTKDKTQFEYKLLNVCTNEVVCLIFDYDIVTNMIDYLIKSKYDKKIMLTDSQFIEHCLTPL